MWLPVQGEAKLVQTVLFWQDCSLRLRPLVTPLTPLPQGARVRD